MCLNHCPNYVLFQASVEQVILVLKNAVNSGIMKTVLSEKLLKRLLPLNLSPGSVNFFLRFKVDAVIFRFGFRIRFTPNILSNFCSAESFQFNTALEHLEYLMY